MSTNASMPETHRQQITDGRAASLIKAGIPASLRDKTLADIDSGAMLGEWLANSGAESLRAGQSWTLETRNNQASSVLPLVARALHIHGVGCRVVRLDLLIRWIEERAYDSLDDLYQPTILFLCDFFEPAARPEPAPFTHYQRRTIQGLLLDRALDKRPVVAQINNHRAMPVRLGDWWDTSLLAGMAFQNLVVE